MTEIPERIAMCAHSDGLHEHVPLDPGEPMLTSCFADCRCTPVEFVRADVHHGVVWAIRKLREYLKAREGDGPMRYSEAIELCDDVIAADDARSGGQR